ncbi:MAG: RDD family protein [Candidatus Hydrogenedentes bacterium]|nr:RDD family protein [Candidatus Hydrogenedentota bacterium]
MLDALIWLPVTVIYIWGSDRYRLFDAYFFLPEMLFILIYDVYFVRLFGGTPGKLIVGLRILKVNGEPITYREACLRYSVDFGFYLLASIALITAAMRMTDAEFLGLGFIARAERLAELTPGWYQSLDYASFVWIWGELVVLLTNKKKRALHDFIAGTIVVHKSLEESVLDPIAVAAE